LSGRDPASSSAPETERSLGGGDPEAESIRRLRRRVVGTERPSGPRARARSRCRPGGTIFLSSSRTRTRLCPPFKLSVPYSAMTRASVDVELLLIALDRASGTEFEKFTQAFYAAELGSEFVPLGGTHDGGADALVLPGVYAERGDPGHFLQVSIEEDLIGKIRQTVKRLREVGRDPTA
jgi:hypothetical protein